MTREKAIKRLEEILAEAEEFEMSACYVTDEDKEILRMVIKALGQEQSEDWYDIPSDKMTLEQARQAVKDLRKMLAPYLMQEHLSPVVERECETSRMEPIKFGANLFEKAIEMQTKTVRACDVIVKIDEELSTMTEPFKMDFICLVTRAVDKCKNMNDKETENNG